MKFSTRIPLAAAVGLGLLSFSAASNADTFKFVQTSDDSTNGVLGGAGPYDPLNYISVTGNATSTTISVFLDPTWSGIVNTGAGPASLSFGLSSGVSSLDFQAVTPGTFSTATSGVQVVGGGTPPLPSTTQTGVLPTTLTANGKFSFTNGFGLDVNSNGGSNPLAPGASGLTLSFILTNISLTTFLADLQTSTKNGNTFTDSHCDFTTPNCFFLDVQKAAAIPGVSPGLTGLIDFGKLEVIHDQGGQTPLPGAVWLFGTVVAGGAGFGAWRRKRKAVA